MSILHCLLLHLKTQYKKSKINIGIKLGNLMDIKPTILYVEDEDAVRNELSKFLKHFSSELYIANDGKHGLELFKKHLPDIVISDVKMPNMNGIEMVKKIKEIKAGQYVIFTSAHSDNNYFIEAIEMRINGFILKPIDLERLEEKISYIIEQINLKKTKELYEGYILQQSRLVQMGEMISMIAHQWRQPLSSISAISTNMQLAFEFDKFDLSDEEQRKEQKNFFLNEFKLLDENLKYLSSIIDDFSSFYKSDKDPVYIKLEEIISKSLHMMSPLIESDNIELSVKYNSDKLEKVYKNELSQVIVNLLKNAQESFINNKVKNPKIKIVTDQYSIKICNNGSHIDQKIIDKIFDPYFSTKGEKNGAGLGLFMSKIIIEKHHKGKLSIKNIKNGVCFNIELAKDK